MACDVLCRCWTCMEVYRSFVRSAPSKGNWLAGRCKGVREWGRIYWDWRREKLDDEDDREKAFATREEADRYYVALKALGAGRAPALPVSALWEGV